jgi:hypothetical protein
MLAIVGLFALVYLIAIPVVVMQWKRTKKQAKAEAVARSASQQSASINAGNHSYDHVDDVIVGSGDGRNGSGGGGSGVGSGAGGGIGTGVVRAEASHLSNISGGGGVGGADVGSVGSRSDSVGSRSSSIFTPEHDMTRLGCVLLCAVKEIFMAMHCSQAHVFVFLWRRLGVFFCKEEKRRNIYH